MNCVIVDKSKEMSQYIQKSIRVIAKLIVIV